MDTAARGLCRWRLARVVEVFGAEVSLRPRRWFET
jgi:hypothetical protein